MGVQFWITIDNGRVRLRLPVTPPSIDINSPFSQSEIEVARLGEVIIPGNRGLTEFSFSSFFPSEFHPSYVGYSMMPAPWKFIEFIEEWRDSKKPARFTVTGTPINYQVLLVDFTYDPERAGNPGDIYYSITLKEYRHIKPREQTIAKPKSASKKKQRPPAPKPKPPKTYTVKKGDTLTAIAKRCYGKGADWPKIYNIAQNKKTIGNNPNRILPGQKLVIP